MADGAGGVVGGRLVKHHRWSRRTGKSRLNERTHDMGQKVKVKTVYSQHWKRENKLTHILGFIWAYKAHEFK